MKKIKTEYSCDQCGDILNNNHISININFDSGIAYAPNEQNGVWEVRKEISRGIYHFCNQNCVASYFEALLK